MTEEIISRGHPCTYVQVVVRYGVNPGFTRVALSPAHENTMTESHCSKNAAAVILLRPEATEGFEVLLSCGSTETMKHGRNYSFPGAGVKKEDCAKGILKRCRGISKADARNIIGSEFTPELSLCLWVAGIRGLFEKTGILLGTTENGCPLDMSDRRLGKNMAQGHKGLIEGSKGFLTLLESEGIFCDTARLVYFSQWLAAEDSPTRTDTRFFLAVFQPDQTLSSVSQGPDTSMWITPDRALDLCQRGSLPMNFPTFATFRTLVDFASSEAVSAEYGLRQ